MKLTTLLLIVSIMQVSAVTFAQKVTLSEKNAPITRVLTQIKSQTGYDFVFTSALLKDANPVTINVKDAELEDALKLIFKDLPLDFTIEDKSVVLSKKSPSFLDRLASAFSNIDVRGHVVDDKGAPLPGATVKVKGTTKLATTDQDGNFYLQNVDENSTLVVTYIGYAEKEVKAEKNLSISLMATASALQEVVVNKGYYSVKQELNTGSVSTVTSDIISRQPVSDPILAIQGRVPGLAITQISGLPGQGQKINIRGRNSIANGNVCISVKVTPLFRAKLATNLITG